MENEESLLDILVEGFKENTRLVGELFPWYPSEERFIYIEEGRCYYEIEIENKMEEARKAVEELNDELYGQGLLDISPFEYRSGGWQNSVVLFMGEIIWTEVDEPREWIEDKFEDLYQFLWKEAKEILSKVSRAMDSEKVASEYLIRMLEAVPNSIDIKYEIDDYGVHFVEVSDENYAIGIIEDVFEERFPDQELLILTEDSLNRVTKPIWSNNEKSR